MGKNVPLLKQTFRWHLCERGMCTQKVMFYGAQVAEAINHYAPDYGFDITVNNLIMPN
ncbi:Glutathione reductase [Mannheimia haemolytica]|nr:Glutathione reductase [Mannheimia haemolytica]